MIGNFDGFHLGHQALLRAARSQAREIGAEVTALTPSPHPRLFFEPHRPLLLLTPGQLKYWTMAGYGLNQIIEPHFDTRFAATEPEEFIEDLLLNQLDARHVVVGEGFRFGRNRRGDAELLQRLANRKGCGVTVHPPVIVRGAICSSSRIRNCVQEGDIAGAEQLLGHALPTAALSEFLRHGEHRLNIRTVSLSA